jgi:hypothetical protein
VSLERIPLPVNENLEFSEVQAEAPFREGKRANEWKAGGTAWIGGLILAEELLRVFNEADDYHHGGAGHAYEEHDLQDVHCEQSNLEHENDCITDGR